MKKSCLGKWLVIISTFFIPILVVFLVIGFHSQELITPFFHLSVFLLLFVSILVFCAGIFMQHRNKIQYSKMGKVKKVLVIVFLSFELFGSSAFLFLLYGPYQGFRTFLVSSAMTTMNHRYFATWFYSTEEIEAILNANQLIESDEDTDLNLIHMEENINTTIYENKYEEAILKKENEDDVYKIIPISEKNFKGYLAVIYDASKIHVRSTKYLNRAGQYVTEMASEEGALLAINGGGFLDVDKKGTGGVPDGVLIQDGKVKTDYAYNTSGGIIGFTTDHKLLLGKMDAKTALSKGVRDAVSFRPFLIVNGKKAITSGNGGWGVAPRTAIGQRRDGIVLMLVTDGRTITNPGATLVEIMNILYNYGAYNAANLDGGTSSVIVLPKEEAKKYITEKEMSSHCQKDYCYINDIVNGSGEHRTRPVASSFVVK